jgi:hypothetical protein
MENKMKKVLMFICILFVSTLFFSNPLAVSAATIALNTTTSYLVKGETTSLQVTGTSKKVIWSSNNKKVVTISNKGVVKAVNYGTTFVKANVNKKTYKCKITVINPSEIYFDTSENEVTVGGTAVNINAYSDTYSNAAITAMGITYNISGNTGAAVSSTGKVTATKTGSFKVTAYVHGKKIGTVSMKAVAGFSGFEVPEVHIESNPATKYDVNDTIGVEGTTIKFANEFVTEKDFKITSSNKNVVVAQSANSIDTDPSTIYGINIYGRNDGTATLSVTISGITKTIKVIVGQGITILAPVDAVKQNNYAGYTGNRLATLQKTRQIIDDNNLMSTTLSDRDKIVAVQTYLNNIGGSNPNDTVYKSDISRVLFDGDGVCDGYAMTFCFLCDCIDIPCYWCGGAADTGDGTGYSGHAWNKVELDGKWYYTDPSWCMAYKNLGEYFLTETLWSNHVVEEEGYVEDMVYTAGEIPYLESID